MMQELRKDTIQTLHRANTVLW